MLPSLSIEQPVVPPTRGVGPAPRLLPLQEELIVRFSPGIIYVSVDLHLNGFEV